MECIWVVNGTTKLCIKPSNEIEKLMLQELFRGPIEAVIPDRLEILDKNITDAVVISMKMDDIKIAK